ncbi:MAG: serine hydroxymethyltransferase [Clostridiales Family XIII bacterium]|jgi:glycine hydroxymethyltransferase|nr:serine hydroxymethyltransferase [Clostridiales Family XIII bacterium]
MYFNYLDKEDSEVAGMIRREMSRQENKIEMIASENFTSAAVMEAVGSALTNKYAEGYPGHRYYGGCEYIDEVETLAIDRAKALFGAEFANVQPHSGANANQAVYVALLKPGDKVMGMSLAEGGHLTHGSKANVSGKYFEFTPYGLDPVTETIDYDLVEELALREKPKMIVCGASAYSRFIDFERFRAIADQVGAYLMVDMAHIAGLVAAGLHPDPFPHAHVVTSTTHKTLRGPRGGVIFAKEELGPAINKGIFPGSQGGPLEHVIAGKAVCFKEAQTEDFRKYQAQVVKNAAVLAEELTGHGFRLVSGGTDNHLVLLNLIDKPYSGKEAEHMLEEADITTNKNAVVGDPRGPQVTSGVRLGTPAMTTRGFKEEDVRKTAEAIALVLNNPGDDGSVSSARAIVRELIAEHPLYDVILKK